MAAIQPRNCLLRLNFFGHDEADSLQVKLNLAYDHFQAFCRAGKIYCSQPRFRPYMVSKCALNCDTNLAMFDFILWWLQCFSSICFCWPYGSSWKLRFTKRMAKSWWQPKLGMDGVSLSGYNVASSKQWSRGYMMMKIKFHYFGLVWSSVFLIQYVLSMFYWIHIFCWNPPILSFLS